MADETLTIEAPQGLSQFERVVDVFIAPTATFKDILRSTSWWLPFLLSTVAMHGMAFTIDRKVGFEQVAETQIQINPTSASQMSSLPPAAQAAQMQKIAVGYRYFTYASPLVVLLFAALASLVLWASFNFGLAARTTFAQIFCLWMFANLPRLLSVVVTIVTLCFGNSPETFNLQQPAGTNIGYYISDATPWLQNLLSYFDVVTFWTMALLILGGSIVAKVKIVQAAAVVIGWWLLIVLVSVAATAAFT